MSTSQEYQALVDYVFSKIKPLGYKRKGTLFWRDFDETRIIIEFQKSRRSTKECSVFTLDLSVICKALLDPEIDNIEKMHGYQGHLYWRIGDFLSPTEDKWWKIDVANGELDHSPEISNILLDVAIPKLEGLTSEGSIISLLKAGTTPPMSDKQRQRLLDELEARLSE